MRSFFSNRFSIAVAALVAVGAPAAAQVEVISPQQAKRYEARLVEIKSSQPQTNFKAFLQEIAPGDTRKTANAVRIARDAVGHPIQSDAFAVHYSVPAYSDMMRLADSYPADGTINGGVKAVLAQNQYEDASFVLYPFKSLENVNLRVSELKTSDGDILSAENLDLRVVKIWYQNGNAWLSFFSDPGLKLVPELLLHDENLIRVDTREEANYARIATDDGYKEQWISEPQKLAIGFNPYQKGFRDAETLQPVRLGAGEFKQFFLTIHAPVGTKAGTYKGHITISAEGESDMQVPVAVRVLSYELPLPKTNYDLNQDFMVSLYGAWGAMPPSANQLKTLENMRRHNMLNIDVPVSYARSMAERDSQKVDAETVELMKRAGFETNVIIGGQLPPNRNDLDGQQMIERTTKQYKSFYEEHLGEVGDIILSRGAARPAGFTIEQRPAWRILERHGMKGGLVGSPDTYFNTSGYNLGWGPLTTSGGDAKTGDKWRQVGYGYIGFFGNQRTGAENPALARREHGMLSYLSNFSMVNNDQFAFGPWNDRQAELYKPMVMAYPISDGLVDTLQWQGFRAGIDDVRYATKLRQLAEEAIDSREIDRAEAGRKVRQWFAQLDGDTANLDSMRLEMIEKIDELIQLKEKKK